MKTKFKNFLNESSILLDSVRKIAYELGEEIDEFVGGGYYGKAFSTKSGKVLKLTNDENEIMVAYKLIKNKNWMKCLINHYNVGKINSSQFKFKYYILMDQVLPLSDSEKNDIDIFIFLMMDDDYWENIKNFNIEHKSTTVKILYPFVLKIAKELKLHKINQGIDFHSGKHWMG